MTALDRFDEIFKHVNSSGLSRRRFLMRATALGAALPLAGLLAACGGDDDDDDDDDTGDAGSTEAATEEATEEASDEATDEATEEASAEETEAGDEGSETEDSGEGDTSGAEQGDYEINLAYAEEPPDLTPHNLTAAAAGDISFVVMPGLVWWDFDLGLSPRIAEKWESSEDGITWTFTLHDNLVFHNGKACTAEEVRRNFEHIQDPNSGSMLTPVFETVESVEATDETTIVFTLKEQYAPFLADLSHRCAIVDMDTYDEVLPVGTGAFKLTNWQRGTGMTLERHDDYYEEGLPKAAKVNWNFYPDADVRLTAMRAGDADITGSVPRQALQQIIDSKEFLVEPISGVTMTFLAFNCAEGPFADVRVRQAVAHTIDREAILQAALWGFGTDSYTAYPEGSPWHVDVEGYPQDFDKAKALLAEAGVPDGFEAEMQIPNTSPDPDIAEIVQADLEQIGIKLTIIESEWATFWPEIYLNKNFYFTCFGYSARVDPDQTFYPRFHSDGVHNAMQYSNPDLDKLLDAGRAEIDPDARKQTYDDAQKLLVEDLPWLWLYLPDVAMGWKDYVSGFQQHPAGHIYLRNVVIDR